MSDYKTELQSNNIDLQSVLETVRSLPEAGGGDSAGWLISVSLTGSGPFAYINADGEYVEDVGTKTVEACGGVIWNNGGMVHDANNMVSRSGIYVPIGENPSVLFTEMEV